MMRFTSFFNNNYPLLVKVLILFMTMSFLTRLAFTLVSLQKSELCLEVIVTIFILGFIYDFGAGLFFIVPQKLYLLAEKFSHTKQQRFFASVIFSSVILILVIFLFL